MELIDLIPKYHVINSMYEKILNDNSISFNNQRDITDFYNDFSYTEKFEKNIIMNSGNLNNISIILNRFFDLLIININIYEKNKTFFDNFDTNNICVIYANSYKHKLNYQQENIKYYSDEFIYSNNDLDAIAYGNFSKEETTFCKNKYEFAKSLYYEEKKILDLLFDEQNELENFAFKYSSNKFNSIYTLSNSFKKITEIYLNRIDKKNEQYFDTNLLISIHKECNKELFEESLDLVFCSEFNLYNSINTLKKIERQNNKIYYLIYKLSETINNQKKTIWIDKILNNLNLNLDTYKSKYKEILKSTKRKNTNDSVYDFVKVIDLIFHDFKQNKHH